MDGRRFEFEVGPSPEPPDFSGVPEEDLLKLTRLLDKQRDETSAARGKIQKLQNQASQMEAYQAARISQRLEVLTQHKRALDIAFELVIAVAEQRERDRCHKLTHNQLVDSTYVEQVAKIYGVDL